MGRIRNGETLVRQSEVAPLVPPASRRPAAGHHAGGGLRGPRLLSAKFAARLQAEARALGFETCRITNPSAVAGAGRRLTEWLATGAAGDMDWLASTGARRADPKKLWPEAVSVVMLGANYAPAGDPLAGLAAKRTGNISVYARNRDYHDVLKGRLKHLAAWLARAAREAGEDAPACKVFVDTAPVMEKPLAQAAGVGWQGKHSNLVSRDFGSWLFLGSIFTTLPLPQDAPESDHCGACRACLDICPTAAFPQPYVLDARRCISYLTIEHKGHIAAEFRAAIGNRIYGCDDCLAVCPWNKFAKTTRDIKLAAREEFCAPRLEDLLRLNEPAFRALFAGSPVKRIGAARFMRNVLIATGNSGDVGLAALAAEHIADASPLVRAMAVWALARLAPERLAALAPQLRPREQDAGVMLEWAAAGSGAGTKTAAQHDREGGRTR